MTHTLVAVVLFAGVAVMLLAPFIVTWWRNL